MRALLFCLCLLCGAESAGSAHKNARFPCKAAFSLSLRSKAEPTACVCTASALYALGGARFNPALFRAANSKKAGKARALPADCFFIAYFSIAAV